MKFYYFPLIFLSIVNADIASGIIQKSGDLYNGVKDKTIQIYEEKIKTKPLTESEIKTLRINKIWSDVVNDLNKGVYYIDKLENVPDKAIFATDKNDVKEDMDKIFERIIDSLIDDNILEYKSKLENLDKKISNNIFKIGQYREDKISAPEKSLTHTTKKQYEEKISSLKEENEIFEKKKHLVKQNLQKQFDEIGVILNEDQINVLLSRVNGDDIIKISLLMNALNDITDQIMMLMKENNEELSLAKKYYGMHQVLLEVVVYMQQKYIDKVKYKYIPDIDDIMKGIKNTIISTKQLIREDEDSQRKSVYQKNLKSLEDSYNVAKLFRDDIQKSLVKMIEAQTLSVKNLKLSKNTYQTVSLSSDLYDLISESQQMFNVISKMQVPDLVPFENIQIQNKYKELSNKLQTK